ncbi:hypothetical protein [Serinicoccus kebangsaanensis]|uniref:hypothetical protein n=1 Tax=Serinicoccus kebangsaanensis TaxID=2602069 RepID=UPI00178C56BE|nr:hypothetical protein [Serinicoccus kebangsaanensis]
MPGPENADVTSSLRRPVCVPGPCSGHLATRPTIGFADDSWSLAAIGWWGGEP